MALGALLGPLVGGGFWVAFRQLAAVSRRRRRRRRRRWRQSLGLPFNKWHRGGTPGSALGSALLLVPAAFILASMPLLLAPPAQTSTLAVAVPLLLRRPTT